MFMRESPEDSPAPGTPEYDARLRESAQRMRQSQRGTGAPYGLACFRPRPETARKNLTPEEIEARTAEEVWCWWNLPGLGDKFHH